MNPAIIISYFPDHSSPVQMALLLHEGLSLVGMLQQHVLTVIGVAAEERVPPFVIYDDEGFRNLKRFVIIAMYYYHFITKIMIACRVALFYCFMHIAPVPASAVE